MKSAIYDLQAVIGEDVAWVVMFCTKIFRTLVQPFLVANVDQSDLIDYIQDAVPELSAAEAAQAVAFHEVTDKDLPHCYCMAGDLLQWNDHFIPPGHPARLHCGEGPFKVVRDESYLVAFQTESDRNKIRGDVKMGTDRLVLQNLSNQTFIIAHGGLFTEVIKGSAGIPNAPVEDRLEVHD